MPPGALTLHFISAVRAPSSSSRRYLEPRPTSCRGAAVPTGPRCPLPPAVLTWGLPEPLLQSPGLPTRTRSDLPSGFYGRRCPSHVCSIIAPPAPEMETFQPQSSPWHCGPVLYVFREVATALRPHGRLWLPRSIGLGRTRSRTLGPQGAGPRRRTLRPFPGLLGRGLWRADPGRSGRHFLPPIPTSLLSVRLFSTSFSVLWCPVGCVETHVRSVPTLSSRLRRPPPRLLGLRTSQRLLLRFHP